MCGGPLFKTRVDLQTAMHLLVTHGVRSLVVGQYGCCSEDTARFVVTEWQRTIVASKRARLLVSYWQD